MMKLQFSLACVCLVLLTSCSRYYNQQMLADGNSWQVNVSDIGLCDGYSSEETCVNNLKPVVETRAGELCGKPPLRVFACQKLVNATGLVGVGCTATCNPGTQIQLVQNTAEGATPNSELIEKAKKCQTKGGVWVSNSCQIALE